MSLSLEEELDRLYERPLDEFVTARNALAKSLKEEGRAEAAKEVKALVKPSVSAWAVNQLFFRARDVFDRVLEAGDACRRAQSELLAGATAEALAKAEADRDEAVEKARRRIAFILSEGRVASGPAVLRRLSTTLEALASFGSANPSPWNGRQSQDLEAPGFRALSGLAASSPKRAPAPVAPTANAEEEQRALSAARLREAEREHEAARAALEAAEAKLQSHRRELQELRDRAARLETELGAAEAQVERAHARLQEKRASLESVEEEKSGGDGAR